MTCTLTNLLVPIKGLPFIDKLEAVNNRELTCHSSPCKSNSQVQVTVTVCVLCKTYLLRNKIGCSRAGNLARGNLEVTTHIIYLQPAPFFIRDLLLETCRGPLRRTSIRRTTHPAARIWWPKAMPGWQLAPTPPSSPIDFSANQERLSSTFGFVPPPPCNPRSKSMVAQRPHSNVVIEAGRIRARDEVRSSLGIGLCTNLFA